jgi:hypothetical protein
MTPLPGAAEEGVGALLAGLGLQAMDPAKSVRIRPYAAIHRQGRGWSGGGGGATREGGELDQSLHHADSVAEIADPWPGGGICPAGCHHRQRIARRGTGIWGGEEMERAEQRLAATFLAVVRLPVVRSSGGEEEWRG